MAFHWSIFPKPAPKVDPKPWLKYKISWSEIISLFVRSLIIERSFTPPHFSLSFLNYPMNNIVFLNRNVLLCVGPIKHALRRFDFVPPNSLLLISVPNLQFIVVFYPLGFHPLFYFRSLIPAAPLDLILIKIDYFIAAKMEIF